MNLVLFGREANVHICRVCNRANFTQDIRKYRGCYKCGGTVFFEAREITLWARLRFWWKYA